MKLSERALQKRLKAELPELPGRSPFDLLPLSSPLGVQLVHGDVAPPDVLGEYIPLPLTAVERELRAIDL